MENEKHASTPDAASPASDAASPASDAAAPGAPAAATIRLAIDGMHCANCAANIEKHYRATPGVVDVAVNLANNTGSVTFDPAIASVDDMLRVFDDLSFTAEVIPDDAPLVDEGRRAKEAARARHDLRVFAASAALTIVIFCIGMLPGAHMAVGRRVNSLNHRRSSSAGPRPLPKPKPHVNDRYFNNFNNRNLPWRLPGALFADV